MIAGNEKKAREGGKNKDIEENIRKIARGKVEKE
jgi:hypothetical protein